MALGLTFHLLWFISYDDLSIVIYDEKKDDSSKEFILCLRQRSKVHVDNRIAMMKSKATLIAAEVGKKSGGMTSIIRNTQTQHSKMSNGPKPKNIINTSTSTIIPSKSFPWSSATFYASWMVGDRSKSSVDAMVSVAATVGDGSSTNIKGQWCLEFRGLKIQPGFQSQMYIIMN